MKAILTYHSIDDSGSPISVPEATFRGHVQWLANSGIAVVSLDELMRMPDDTDAIAITFDDGFANFGSVAWPLLQEHELPVTLFVVSDHAGASNSWSSPRFPDVPRMPLLDWTELGMLAEAGLHLGSHTRHHPDLRTLSGSSLADEIAGAAEQIQARTGTRPRSFAYPYGACNDTVVAAVRGHHEIACTTELRPLGKREDWLRLPRLDAFYFRRPGLLEGWGSGAFQRYLWMRASGRRLRRALEMTGVHW